MALPLTTQVIPFLTAEQVLVGDPGHVILTGSMVARRNKNAETEGADALFTAKT